jgi:hypothetical protein
MGRPFGGLASCPRRPGGAAPAGETVRLLEIAGALLADEAVWDGSSIRTDDPVNGRYTLYSALATACHEVTGRYLHRHPALEAVRAEIQDRGHAHRADRRGPDPVARMLYGAVPRPSRNGQHHGGAREDGRMASAGRGSDDQRRNDEQRDYDQVRRRAEHAEQELRRPAALPARV